MPSHVIPNHVRTSNQQYCFWYSTTSPKPQKRTTMIIRPKQAERTNYASAIGSLWLAASFAEHHTTIYNWTVFFIPYISTKNARVEKLLPHPPNAGEIPTKLPRCALHHWKLRYVEQNSKTWRVLQGLPWNFKRQQICQMRRGWKKGDFQGLDEGTKKIILLNLTFDHNI